MRIDFPLATPRLLVRPFRPEDATGMHDVYGDVKVMRYVGRGRPVSMDETRAMLDEYIRHQREHGYAFWAVCDRQGGQLIGDAGFEARDDGAEFGYTLGRAWWGRGLATEAGRLCLDAVNGFDLPRITAVVDPANPASAGVLRKLGFEFSREREAYGRPHHEYRLTPRRAGVSATTTLVPEGDTDGG